MDKILLPVEFPTTSLTVVRQAAFLARHFHSEIILLHVVASMSYPVGMIELGYELTGGLHADVVKRAARDEKVNLIMMSTHSHGVFYRFLLGSVAAKVLHDSDCSVWADAYTEEAPPGEFAIRNVLCAVDLSHHSRNTVARAAQIAAEFEARLTLVHITAGVEIYGPGGPSILPKWKEELVGYAAMEIAKLQQDVGTKAEVIIDSGDVHQLLNRAAEQSKGDLLVIGHFSTWRSFGSQPQWLRDHSRVAHPSAERLRKQAEKCQKFSLHGKGVASSGC